MADKNKKPKAAEQVTKSTTNDLTKDIENSAREVLGEDNIEQAQKMGQTLTGAAQKTKQVVGTQLGNISDKLGGEEFVGELNDMSKPILALVSNMLMIAFFAKKQDRVSRGQYIVGSLATFIIMGLFVSILSAIVGPMGVRGGLVFIVAPLVNLSVKRFQDIGLSPWRAATIIVPFVGWVVPVLFQGEAGENEYGPNPATQDKTDMMIYLVSGLSLFVISMLVTTLLGFLGFRVSQPDVDITDPNMIGEEIGDQAPGQLGKPVEAVDDLGNDAKNVTDGTKDMTENAVGTATKKAR